MYNSPTAKGGQDWENAGSKFCKNQREETISKLIKKGDERRERKKVAASNPERGLVDEPIIEDEGEPKHSFVDLEDLNFVPTSQHTESADAHDDRVEIPPPSKHTKRKLNVDESKVSKPSLSKKGKKQRVATPATSIKSEKLGHLSKGKGKPAPSKKPLVPHSPPKSKKKFVVVKSPAAKSRKNVGHSSTPTQSSPGESVFVLMVRKAHSTRI